ncbi:hypothetical protein ABZZ19_10950, partial [Streptomyces sp. NPDC006341]
MAAIEEELVAGESPDKSVDEAAPGAAETSAERDPRLSVFRPRDPEGGSGGRADGAAAEPDPGPEREPEPESDSAQRDPLREAVAAWVATADDPVSDEEPGAPAGPSGRVDPAKPAGAPAGGARPVVRDSASAGVDKPVADRSSDGEGSGDSERTAVFRAVKPAAGAPGAGSAGKAGSAAPEDARRDSASVGAGKPVADRSPDAEGSDDSERTAVFRAVKPTDAAEKPAQDAAKQGDSERTAVFRAVKPAAGAPGVGSAGKAGSAAPEDARRDSASVGSGKPAADRSPDAEGSGDSERTAVFRAVKPAAGAPGVGSAGKAGSAAPEDARRDSASVG